MNWKKLSAGALTLALLLTGGCGNQIPTESTPPAPSADTSPTPSSNPFPTWETPVHDLVFTLPVDPAGTWNPYVGSRGNNMAILPLLCEPLFALSTSFEPEPLLAQGIAGSEDGLTWTVKVRENVTFSDGTPLTAEVVAGCVKAARGEKSLYKGRFTNVKKVTFDRENNVIFELYSPNSDFAALLDFPIALVRDEGVFGTGPYIREEDALVARSGYWQGKTMPRSSIPLVNVTDADGLIAAFDSGELSLAAADLTGADTLGYSGTYQTWDYPTTTMLYLGYRCDRGPCKDKAFRQLLARCLDRGGIVTQVLEGHASVAGVPVPPTSPRYPAALAARLGYDPQKGAEALEELGYHLGEDGLRCKGRTPLELSLVVNSDNSFKARMAQKLAEDLGALGVTVTVRELGWEQYQKALKSGDFDLYLGECRLQGDLDLTGFFTPGSGLCFGNYQNRELTAALGEARQTGSWQEFYELWAEEAPFGVLCFKMGTVLTRWGQVTGMTPTQGNLFYQFENWKIS